MKLINAGIILLLSITLSSCVVNQFSTANVNKIKHGMSQQEVIAIFGRPKYIGQFVGGANTSTPWKAITYMYYYNCYNGTCEYNNTFVFNAEDPTNVYLYDWTIQYQY